MTKAEIETRLKRIINDCQIESDNHKTARDMFTDKHETSYHQGAYDLCEKHKIELQLLLTCF